ncbi:uncharacterized protein LOC119628475 [Bombyx mori]|uniref:uncharacterized protein LOC119628475 n=1 Tax=Bombyx mori TaxID=7091 RepID=UPI002ED2610E
MDKDNHKTYKIMSFNCMSLKRSMDCIRLLSKKVDVMALQETWLLPTEVPDLGLLNKDFSYFGKSAMDKSSGLLRGRPYGGVGLLWRNDSFQSVSVIPCASERIVAIKVCVADRSMLFFSVYMPTNELDHLCEFVECLSEISAIVENEHVESIYVLGDFNAHPGKLFGNEMLSFCAEQNWLCADIERLGIDSQSYTYTSDAHGTCSWLDHCLTSVAAWRTVVNVKIHYDVFWSDHFPLEVECNLERVRSMTIPPNISNVNKIIWGERTGDQIDMYFKYCNDKLKLIDFPLELNKCCDKMCTNVNHQSVINNFYMCIINVLTEASINCYDNFSNKCEITHRGIRPLIGWNKHVRSAHRVARQTFLCWVWNGKPRKGTVYRDMVESRKIFKKQLKFCQNHQEQIKMNILATKHEQKDFRGFWKQTRRLSPKAGIPVSIDGECEPVRIANLFRNHFRVQSPGQLSRGADAGVVDPSRPSHVPPRITTKEITKIIMNMTKGKSPGHDHLSIEHFQHAGPHLPRLLALLYTFCIRHSYLPGALMRTVVVPILKNKTGDVSDRNNYRPISLATITAKVLDAVLERQVSDHLTLSDAQFGFRPMLSTECAILSLKHVVGYYTERNTPVYAVFLDLSKAFDLVRYDLLWGKLRQTGVPGPYVDLFSHWYEYQTNQVRWSNTLSEEYRLECGVRQGGLTSPALFNLYINELIEALGEARVGCSIDGHCVNSISYADDMVLLSPSIGALRRLLSICERYAESHGLRYNVKKSELLVFKAAKTKPSYVPPVTLGGTPLKRVTEFKYLGHIVTEHLKDDADIERERRALAVRCSMLARRFYRCTAQVKVTLFKAFCQSLYTCTLWVRYARRTYNALRVQYNNAFRMLLGLPRYCSASGMFADAHVDDFSSIIRKRTASLMRGVRASTNNILMVIGNKPECAVLGSYTYPYTRCLKAAQIYELNV